MLFVLVQRPKLQLFNSRIQPRLKAVCVKAGILVGSTLECGHRACGSHSTGPDVVVASNNHITAYDNQVKDSFLFPLDARLDAAFQED